MKAKTKTSKRLIWLTRANHVKSLKYLYPSLHDSKKENDSMVYKDIESMQRTFIFARKYNNTKQFLF